MLLAAGLVAARWGSDAVSLVLLGGALLVGGATFVPQSLRALLTGRLGVGTLMTIAAIGAVVLGEVGEAAGLAFLFSISEALESYSLDRSRRSLRALLSLVPERATVLRGDIGTDVSPADLELGDVLVVRPGERVATDGTVRSGRSALDVSAITGESVPVEAGPGAAVFAGSINGNGALEVEVTARAESNSLARIVHIVEEAQERKGSSQRLAERIARPLVPGVMVLAAAIAVVGSLLGDPAVWTERALVVLVAAAPCAFAISVPVTVFAAIGAAGRSGVLIKGGAALEALGRIRAVALDKTGTLTRNHPAVIDVVAIDGVARARVLEVAAALESRSEHPLAAAILAATPGYGTPGYGTPGHGTPGHGTPGHGTPGQDTPGQDTADGVEAVPGAGLTGTVDGRPARLGRPGFLDAGPLAARVAELQGAGATVVLVEHDGALLGAVAVRDELRPEAPAVVAALRGAGLRVAMLTGDNRRTADALAHDAGITDVHADLRPEDKARIVTELRGPVAMVGDGINDAPALATADSGIAMGAMGTDVAIEAADVALMGEDLRHLPAALAHARRARRIMVQNLAMSGVILLTLVPLAASGVLGLAAVVAAHELAEVLVIANGVRAGRRTHLTLPAAAAAAPTDTPADGGCTDGCCPPPEAGARARLQAPDPVRAGDRVPGRR
ncbi:cation-translocating P-type ATPase [Pseudonocardia abyssalis]|uniref:Cation-translocating P-type ATPase n=3 Tax=Pseudonocardia abyssalis TaxID=2792008 RepID=A0ABS6ULD5_9PSEU|nr:cation-translocating P-type ATPase [Pseudonocardia abyssalis]